MTRSRSPGSTIDDGRFSEMDDHNVTHPSSPVRTDPRTSLQHVLGTDSSRDTPPAKASADMTEDEEARTPGPTIADTPTTTTAGTGRKKKDAAAGNTQQNTSIYSGNKVRHLKKDDGEPLWRKDIQYDFLKAVFENDTACFTNSYEPENIGKQTFANLYIDAMARSSKTSKILRDKLLTEHEPAKNMAMVCLLVNLGRMNTTLNFFPEMRAQLRTYHAIPSLQAHQDPNSYKQLQDAPRLKSILKGASEDRPEPNTLEKIKAREVPRTNPVNLIFVLSQFAPKVTELHFPPGRDFYDLIMRTNLSSQSRARAFLWLMWFYLESDFTEEGAEENVFGAGVDYDVQVRNQGVPRFVQLKPEEQEAENIDSPEELEYGQAKMRERKRIIEADQAAFQAEHGPPKRGPKPKLHLPPDDGGSAFMGRMRSKNEEFGASPGGVVGRMRPKYESDLDSTRSTPPPRALGTNMRIQSVLNTGGKARGSLKHQVTEGSSPVAQPLENIPSMRRSRPLTAHQLAVERNRNQRVDYILSRGLRKKHHHSRKGRKQEGAFVRAMRRINSVVDPLDDSECEDYLLRNPAPFRERGFGGLVQLDSEEDDFGEEMSAYAASFRRMGRRLARWDDQKDLNLGVMGTNRVPVATNGHVRDDDETEDDAPLEDLQPRRNGNLSEVLDDIDKEILGLGSEADDDADEDLNDDDKMLLGLGGDETEEDISDGAMDMD
ncbi:Ino eighty subunit [Lachnellula willkommii]|uniref:Ino eighty subunit n=1 Tax=Lachnellula willkommii TaxID=215461 RepID=A0A559MMB8_9HELO|nr:Ino eighty subunit [Lachnellula willkommii]